MNRNIERAIAALRIVEIEEPELAEDCRAMADKLMRAMDSPGGDTQLAWGFNDIQGAAV